MVSSKYEIFKGSPSDPIWVESLDNLDTASLHMRERAETHPGAYFIFCRNSGRILETIDTSKERNRQPSRSVWKRNIC
jgi:hypothetical protein